MELTSPGRSESAISRQRRKADYHCLDPWTAETSGKWPGGRKIPYQATAKKEHGGTAISLRGGISEAVANPRRRCQFSVFRSCPQARCGRKVSVLAPSPFDGITAANNEDRPAFCRFPMCGYYGLCLLCVFIIALKHPVSQEIFVNLHLLHR